MLIFQGVWHGNFSSAFSWDRKKNHICTDLGSANPGETWRTLAFGYWHDQRGLSSSFTGYMNKNRIYIYILIHLYITEQLYAIHHVISYLIICTSYHISHLDFQGQIHVYIHNYKYNIYIYLELPVVRNYRSKLKQHFFLLFGLFFALFQK